eukprot:2327333-Rhodomonas_salina.4
MCRKTLEPGMPAAATHAQVVHRVTPAVQVTGGARTRNAPCHRCTVPSHDGNAGTLRARQGESTTWRSPLQARVVANQCDVNALCRITSVDARAFGGYCKLKTVGESGEVLGLVVADRRAVDRQQDVAHLQLVRHVRRTPCHATPSVQPPTTPMLKRQSLSQAQAARRVVHRRAHPSYGSRGQVDS